MKKNYFAPKAKIIDTLCDEYCAGESISAGVVTDVDYTDGYVTGTTGTADKLGYEY